MAGQGEEEGGARGPGVEPQHPSGTSTTEEEQGEDEGDKEASSEPVVVLDDDNDGGEEPPATCSSSPFMAPTPNPGPHWQRVSLCHRAAVPGDGDTLQVETSSTLDDAQQVEIGSGATKAAVDPEPITTMQQAV